MTIDLNTATAEELAEYVMRKLGWSKHGPSHWVTFPNTRGCQTAMTFACDLNLIAAAMPPGWDTLKTRSVWSASLFGSFGDEGNVEVTDTGDERLDRLRLAALAWQAESKSKENSK